VRRLRFLALISTEFTISLAEGISGMVLIAAFGGVSASGHFLKFSAFQLLPVFPQHRKLIADARKSDWSN